jgi:hypothetical protein
VQFPIEIEKKLMLYLAKYVLILCEKVGIGSIAISKLAKITFVSFTADSKLLSFTSES